MAFTLVVINTELVSNHLDKKFSSMDELLAWVKEEKYEWTSLVITVLP